MSCFTYLSKFIYISVLWTVAQRIVKANKATEVRKKKIHVNLITRMYCVSDSCYLRSRVLFCRLVVNYSHFGVEKDRQD